MNYEGHEGHEELALNEREAPQIAFVSFVPFVVKSKLRHCQKSLKLRIAAGEATETIARASTRAPG